MSNNQCFNVYITAFLEISKVVSTQKHFPVSLHFENKIYINLLKCIKQLFTNTFHKNVFTFKTLSKSCKIVHFKCKKQHISILKTTLFTKCSRVDDMVYAL